MIRVSDKVMIPQEEHPEINFVGLLIGPRGNTLKSEYTELLQIKGIICTILKGLMSFFPFYKSLFTEKLLDL